MESVVSARGGRIDVQGDERFLVLESGQRSDVNTASGETTLAGFETYRALVDIKALRRVREQPPKTMATVELMRTPTPRNQGELAWRFGLMLAAVNLSLLAIGLAHVNTRRPSNLNLVVALRRLAGLLQLDQPDADLGGQRPLRHGAGPAGAARRRVPGGAGAAVVARPCGRAAVPPRRQALGAGMKTVRRMLYRDIVSSVAFVALAFLSLSFFIDFVDELQKIGRPGFTLWFAVGGAMLELPGNLYELLPIAVLIGTIYSMARLAQTSEFTILRTGGLSPLRALRLLALLGLGVQRVDLRHRRLRGARSPRRRRRCSRSRSAAGASSAAPAPGSRNGASPTRASAATRSTWPASTAAATLVGIRIFEFDADGRHLSRIVAEQGRVGADSTWTLTDAERHHLACGQRPVAGHACSARRCRRCAGPAR